MDDNNADFDRCINFILEMLEKYGAEVMAEIENEQVTSDEDSDLVGS